MMLRGQLGSKPAGTILTRTSRASTRVPRRPAPPLPTPAAKPAKKPSALNKFKLEPVKMGNHPQNLPSKFLNTIRNRQAMKILGFKEEREHHLLKRAIAREMQKARKPVPKKKKSPEGAMKRKQMQFLLKPNETGLIRESHPNVPLPFKISSILSLINTNSEFRKMLRKSRVPVRTKAKYLDSQSATNGSALGISKRYSKLGNLKVRQQKRPTASA